METAPCPDSLSVIYTAVLYGSLCSPPPPTEGSLRPDPRQRQACWDWMAAWLIQNVPGTFMLLESLVLSLSASPTYCWHPSFSTFPTSQTVYSDLGKDILWVRREVSDFGCFLHENRPCYICCTTVILYYTCHFWKIDSMSTWWIAIIFCTCIHGPQRI